MLACKCGPPLNSMLASNMRVHVATACLMRMAKQHQRCGKDDLLSSYVQLSLELRKSLQIVLSYSLAICSTELSEFAPSVMPS